LWTPAWLPRGCGRHCVRPAARNGKQAGGAFRSKAIRRADGLWSRAFPGNGTVARGTEALGALAGGALAAVAGIRAPMLAGAVPIAAVTALLAWRHRGAAPAADATSAPSSG